MNSLIKFLAIFLALYLSAIFIRLLYKKYGPMVFVIFFFALIGLTLIVFLIVFLRIYE